jgi:hypothetical protein
VETSAEPINLDDVAGLDALESHTNKRTRARGECYEDTGEHLWDREESDSQVHVYLENPLTGAR